MSRQHHHTRCGEVITLYREGYSCAAIARRMGTDSWVIRAFLRAHNEPKGQGRHDHSKCEELIARYQDRGESTLAVSIVCGMSPFTVARYLRLHGISVRSPGGLARHAPRDAEMVACVRAGETLTAVGKRYGVTREWVRQVALRAGVKAASLPRSCHRCGAACAAVLAAVVPVAILPLSRETGISPVRIITACRAHGVVTRSRVEAQRHHCTERCDTIRALLATGVVLRQIARQVGFATTSLYGRYRAYHPDWPWPERYAANRHRCDSRCAHVEAALARGSSLAGTGVSYGRLETMRRYHLGYAWPSRRQLTSDSHPGVGAQPREAVSVHGQGEGAEAGAGGPS